MASVHLKAWMLALAVPWFAWAEPPTARAQGPRGVLAADAELLSGPDRLAIPLGKAAAGTAVTIASAPIRGYVRVRLDSGESGYVPAERVQDDTGVVLAADEAPPSTVLPIRLGVHVGAVHAQHADLDGFDDGLAFDVTASVAVTPNVRLEGTVGRYAMSADVSGWGPELGNLSGTFEARCVPVVLGLRLVLPADRLEASVFAGLGMGFFAENATGTSSNLGSVSASDSSTGSVRQIGAGLALRMSPRARVELDLRYLVAKTTAFDVARGMDTLLFTGGMSVQF